MTATLGEQLNALIDFHAVGPKLLGYEEYQQQRKEKADDFVRGVLGAALRGDNEP